MEDILTAFENHINSLTFFPILILIVTILFTYTWSALSERLKLIIFFITGFIIFGGLVERFILLNMHIDLPPLIITMISGIIGGLIELGAYAILKPLSMIGVFIGGAIVTVLALLKFGILPPDFFKNLNRDSAVIALAILAVAGGCLYLVIFQSNIFQLIGSSIGGAIVLTFLLSHTKNVLNIDIANVDIKTLSKIYDYRLKTMAEDQILLLAFIAITAILSQSILLFFLKTRKRSKT